ncbi:MAG: four helix bundle protein [Bacteroidales bacterium]|jgi:four helix bundle protein
MDDGKPNIIKDKSFELAITIVGVYRYLQEERNEFVLSKQLLRSGTSIGANVREAVNAESTKDFIHKMSIAQKECDETMYWLELLKSTGYIDSKQFDKIKNQANEIYKILKSIIITTKQKKPNS